MQGMHQWRVVERKQRVASWRQRKAATSFSSERLWPHSAGLLFIIEMKTFEKKKDSERGKRGAEKKGRKIRGEREKEIGRKQRNGNVKCERKWWQAKLPYNDGTSPKGSASETEYQKDALRSSSVRKKPVNVSIHPLRSPTLPYHVNP